MSQLKITDIDFGAVSEIVEEVTQDVDRPSSNPAAPQIDSVQNSPATPASIQSLSSESTIQTLSELPDDDLVNAVDAMKRDCKHLELENQIFESFLLLNEPSLLTGFNFRKTYTLVPPIMDLLAPTDVKGPPPPELVTFKSVLQNLVTPDKGAR